MDTKQLQKIIDEELKKAILEEGFLDSLKFAVSKLPNLERRKGPKVDAAIKQVGKIIDKESNQRFKEMMKALEARLPGFPNVKTHEDFLQGMEEFAMLYDGIVEEYNDGKLEAPIANALIGDLRVVVRKFLDYDLKDVYKHFKENQEKIDEALPFTNQAKIDKAAEKMRQDDQGGPIGSKYGDESETIKGLQSNILPGVLAMGGVGTLLGGAAWFRELLNAPGASPDTIIDGTKRVFATVKDGDGFSQTLGRFLHNNPNTYGENFGARNFFENVKSLGITPDDPGPLQQMADDPTAFKQEWATISDQIQNNPDASMSDVFPASNKAFWIQKGAQVALGKLPKVIGGAVASTSGAAAGAATAGVFGAGLLASAAAVKLLRMKGLKSSRAQVFKDMLDVFKDVEPKTAQEQELQSGLEDIGVIKKLGPGAKAAQLGAGEKAAQLGAGEKTAQLGAGELRKALEAGTGPLSLMPGQIKRSIGSGAKIPGDTGFTTLDGVPIAVGGIYNYTKNPKRKVFQYLSREAAKNAPISEDKLEEGEVSSGTFQKGEKTFIKITSVDTKGPKAQFKWIEVDPSTGESIGEEQIPFDNLAKLGMPVDIADNPVARFAKGAEAQKKKDSEPPVSTPDTIVPHDMENRIRLQLQKAMNKNNNISTREKALEDLYKVLMYTKVIIPFESSEEEPRVVTENNVVEILRDLKNKKILNIKESKINKFELVLEEHNKKLIEEQKIHNHWKKYAGLLKG
jgi:soluble cytochrome b562